MLKPYTLFLPSCDGYNWGWNWMETSRVTQLGDRRSLAEPLNGQLRAPKYRRIKANQMQRRHSDTGQGASLIRSCDSKKSLSLDCCSSASLMSQYPLLT